MPQQTLRSALQKITDTALDKNNNFIIADTDSHCIRKVTPMGVVSTIAGFALSGYEDGPALEARFNQPSGIDKDGNIYVADTGNHRIRKISTDGKVTTIAGDGTDGYKEGLPDEAQFSSPLDVAIASTGELYILDSGNLCVRLLK